MVKLAIIAVVASHPMMRVDGLQIKAPISENPIHAQRMCSGGEKICGNSFLGGFFGLSSDAAEEPHDRWVLNEVSIAETGPCNVGMDILVKDHVGNFVFPGKIDAILIQFRKSKYHRKDSMHAAWVPSVAQSDLGENIRNLPKQYRVTYKFEGQSVTKPLRRMEFVRSQLLS